MTDLEHVTAEAKRIFPNRDVQVRLMGEPGDWCCSVTMPDYGAGGFHGETPMESLHEAARIIQAMMFEARR